ncbi:MAG: D-alanyl-D-alanine carboxypeptidase family protein [Hormoscilla sp. SP12CHS1]|nr:D-alanyl-D-alanine carboxypeptidase family protein [Hormoscilla sp. SP12CHS1]
MHNAGLYEEISTVDDIPEALRDAIPSREPQNRRDLSTLGIVIIGSLVGVVAIAVGSISWFTWQASQVQLLEVVPEATKETKSSRTMRTMRTMVTTAMISPAKTTTPATDALLGHFPYSEATGSELAPIVADGSLKLRKAAAAEFLAMVDAARMEGVNLVPISGFRSLADQEYLFFQIKAQLGQVSTERSEVSAPPGYSEHHTGYAVDIGDGNVPATHLSPNFERTAAFKWLQANAAYFSFELSFPRNNPQGVSYEPWHWRFTGDRHSLETFYKDRQK